MKSKAVCSWKNSKALLMNPEFCHTQILQMSESTNPFSLAVFGDVLYWSDPRKRMVQAAHKITGKNRQVVLKRPRQPFAVKASEIF